MKTLHYVDADDWAAVYVDEKCVFQGHSIPRHVWLELLEDGPYEVDASMADSDHAYLVAGETGGFPDTWVEFLAYPNQVPS